jgi:hypothetical protein
MTLKAKENFGSLLEDSFPYNFTHSFHPIKGRGLAMGVVPLDFKIRRILLPVNEKY